MAELAAARAEVEAAARAAAAELEALRGNSISSSLSADDELKLVREAAREQTAQWAATPRGCVVAAAQTGVDTPAARSTEITTFTGGATLPPRTSTMVTIGSRPLSGTNVGPTDVGPGGGWPTLNKTIYVEWAAVMRIWL
jgi:hypothetical protein